ncbi:MAG: MarR family transcriptional regulator [Pseudomonadaceae bacterium]|nr:MarR family transcriptional regulator [Pseudomonadaceae bacterium]
MSRSKPTADELFVLFNEIGMINQLASNRFERRLPDGLSTAQFSVLNHFVRLGEERTPSRLAEIFQVTRGAMTNTLKRLERKGCVKLTSDPADGRGKIVNITAKGRKVRDQAIASAAVCFDDLYDSISKSEYALLLPILQRLRQQLDINR